MWILAILSVCSSSTLVIPLMPRLNAALSHQRFPTSCRIQLVFIIQQQEEKAMQSKQVAEVARASTRVLLGDPKLIYWSMIEPMIPFMCRLNSKNELLPDLFRILNKEDPDWMMHVLESTKCLWMRSFNSFIAVTIVFCSWSILGRKHALSWLPLMQPTQSSCQILSAYCSWLSPLMAIMRL